MKIVVAADHGGVELKDHLAGKLAEAGYDVIDLGTEGSESVDYPDFGHKAACAVVRGDAPLGIVCCGTGIGISIAANKVDGIRCAKVNTPEEGALAAEHNHANMLAFGGRVTGPDTAWEAVQAWLNTERGEGRHARRVQKIGDIERTC